MLENVSIITQIIELGIIMSFVGLGTFISSQLLNFNDLSIEGSFSCGSAMSILAAKMGITASGQLFIALIAGSLVGLLTSIFHFKLGINKIIAGLLSTTAFFSINLKLAGPHALMPTKLNLFATTTWLGESHRIITLLCIGLITFIIITKFLRSEIGLLLRAAGDNPIFVKTLGKNAIAYQTLGLMLSNSLSALSGYMFTSFTGFFSITSNTGVLPIALAGIILSRMIPTSAPYKIIIGSILYQVAITCCISLNIDPCWNKLLTATIILALIISQKSDITAGVHQ